MFVESVRHIGRAVGKIKDQGFYSSISVTLELRLTSYVSRLTGRLPSVDESLDANQFVAEIVAQIDETVAVGETYAHHLVQARQPFSLAVNRSDSPNAPGPSERDDAAVLAHARRGGTSAAKTNGRVTKFGLSGL